MKAKVILWPRKLANGDYPLKLRVSEGSQNVYNPTGISVNKAQWDTKKQALKGVKPSQEQKYIDYLNLRTRISDIEKGYNEKIKRLAIEGRKVTIDQLIQMVENPVRENTVFNYFDETINRCKLAGKIGSAKVYRMTWLSLEQFNNKVDFKFHDIDLHFLKRYEDYLRQKDLKDTTISILFRTLRTLYNNAIGEGYAKQTDYPFGKKSDNTTFTVSKFNDKTPKRAITKEQLKAIEAVELPKDLETAREFFLFSYYAAGINFNDICKLKWENIKGNHISYIRSKTGMEIRTFLLPYPKEIINKYRLQTGIDERNYIFPVLNIHFHKTPRQIDDRSHKVLGQVNRDLKYIATKAGIKQNISTYTARHSFITHAANNGEITPFELQSMVGHKDIATTMIYYKDSGQDKKDSLMQKFIGS